MPAGQPCVVHFTKLYGAAIGPVLVGVVAWALARPRPRGFAFWHFALWYSVLRALVEEPFRNNPLVWRVYLDAGAGVGFFTLAQLACIAIVLLSIGMLARGGGAAPGGGHHGGGPASRRRHGRPGVGSERCHRRCTPRPVARGLDLERGSKP